MRWPPASDIRRWLALLGLSVPYYATITLSPLLNGAAMDTLGVDSFAIGVVRTLEVLVNALTTIALAPRLARFDIRRLGAAGILLMLAGAAGGAATGGGYAGLLAARLAAGIGAGLAQCAAAAMMAETRSPQRVGGGLMIPITLCAVAAALAGGRAVEAAGQSGVFLTLASACAFGLILASAAPRGTGATAGAAVRPDAARTSLGALRSSYVLAAALVFVGSTASWNFFERKGRSLGLDGPDISTLIAAAALAAGLFGVLSVLIRDRWVRPACFLAIAGFTLCAALVPLAPAPAAFAGAYVAQTICYALTANLLTAMGVRLDPTGGLAAAGRGWSTLFNAAAPALGGALILAGGFAPLGALCVLMGGLSLLFLRKAPARPFEAEAVLPGTAKSL